MVDFPVHTRMQPSGALNPSSNIHPQQLETFGFMAQVPLFMMHTEEFRHFGTDNEETLVENDLEHLWHYNVELDKWRNTW
jgi:hypothetical protein